MSAIPSMLLCCPSSSSSSSSPSTLSPSSSSPSSSAAALSPLSVPVSPMPTRRRRSLGRSSQLHVQGSRRYSAQRGAGMFRPSVSCSPNNNNPSNDNSGLRSSKIQRNRCYKHKQPSHVEIISIKKLKKEAFRKLNFQMAHDQLAFVQRLAYAHDNHRVFMSSRSGDSPAPLTDSITSRVGSLTLERMSSDMLLDGAGAPCDSTKDNDEDICTSLYRMDGLGLVDELDDIELLLDGMCGISVCQDEFDRVLEFEELHHYDIHHLDAAIGDLF